MVRSLLLHRQLFYEARQLSAAAHRHIRKGRFRVEYRGEFHVAEAGDVLLLDCIEPHYYHAEDGLEFVYMHFEGSNARELCRRITDRHGWLIRRDNNTLIGNLLYDMVRFYDENGVETDMQRSARIYRMFDLLLSPSAAEQSADTPVEQAIQYSLAYRSADFRGGAGIYRVPERILFRAYVQAPHRLLPCRLCNQLAH
ncbi:MAG: AraC family ligand binding domain-containing protein [Butyricicoccaceae bacterium]